MAAGILAQTPTKRTHILEQLARNLETTAAVLRELSALEEPTQAEPAGDATSEAGELLLTAVAAGRLIGVGPTRFYELRREPSFPAPVQLPGQRAEDRYRRADLKAWVASLLTARTA